MFYNSKTLKVYGWLHLVINGLQPFSILENPAFRNSVRLEAVSYKNFVKYMQLLTSCVEQKIESLLPSKIALVFDGWTSNSTHYIALHATFPSEFALGYSKILLGFSPLEDEKRLDAESHMSYIKFVLGLFDKSIDDVVALIVDNCSTNHSVAEKVSTSFIGCASHRYNLAVQDVSNPSDTYISKVTL